MKLLNFNLGEDDDLEIPETEADPDIEEADDDEEGDDIEIFDWNEL